MTEEQYYWEKAEFQDPEAHARHVENYRKGIRDSVAFDEEYQAEATASCPYCRGTSYTDKKFKVLTQSGNEVKVRFNYCPFCGKNLYEL